MLAFGQCYGCIYEGERCAADLSAGLKNDLIHNKPCCAKISTPALHYFLTHTSKKELLRLRAAAYENPKSHE